MPAFNLPVATAAAHSQVTLGQQLLSPGRHKNLLKAHGDK